ncbi:YncE family protein [Frateuria hangzhouensis]|uniref:YncE family protein n=1 Tax=Frateuria hangzhouensis TaxID=2995589 RepID=UPI002260DBE0|nr:cytochrome D1 domain-containing protein [Frateuria sp. STR12]MCX7513401.1 YncE family protein [Frateuria sp. STR12]
MPPNNDRSTPHRLRLALACCTLAAAGCLGATAARAAESHERFPEPVYVTLQSSDAVERMPSDAAWDALPGAHYDAISADGRRMLVSSKDRPEAYLLDPRNGRKLATLPVGPTPQGVAISPDGRWGLAVSAGQGTVAVIDMAGQRVARSIAVGKVPHNARFSADGKLAYVTLQGAGGVAVLDMASLAKVDAFPVPGIHGPHNLDLSADGRTLWVRDLVGKVAAVDLASRKVLAVIPVGLGHGGIDVIPGGRYVFAGAIADHVVDVIDPATFKVVKRIEVGQGPHGVRASRDGRWVYVGVTGTDKLAVIDTRTLEVTRQLATHGRLPFWLAVPGND